MRTTAQQSRHFVGHMNMRFTSTGASAIVAAPFSPGGDTPHAIGRASHGSPVVAALNDNRTTPPGKDSLRFVRALQRAEH